MSRLRDNDCRCVILCHSSTVGKKNHSRDGRLRDISHFLTETSVRDKLTNFFKCKARKGESGNTPGRGRRHVQSKSTSSEFKTKQS